MQLDEKLLEESLEDLYENAPCGYVSTLPDGTFAKVNHTLLRWTGYDREELVGVKHFVDILTVASKIYHETHYAPLLQMQGSVDEIALDLVRRDGSRLPVLLNSVQLRDASGAPLLNRTTIFNASERREYERELLVARRRAEQADQAKARFLSTVSHEIRNPLSAISLAAELLDRTELNPKQQRYVRNLTSGAQSLLALVNDILDYSKIEAGAVTLDEHRVDIRELVSEQLNRLETRAEEKQLALVLEVDERVPAFVLVDPIKLGQVLTNLLSNAVKFTDQGSVKLALQVQELLPDAVAIDFSVQDTGIGIPPDRMPYIFEEFMQASSSIATKYGGTGLGLAISRKLLQLYGSEIRLESTPGQGSTFSFMVRLKHGHPAE